MLHLIYKLRYDTSSINYWLFNKTLGKELSNRRIKYFTNWHITSFKSS